MNVFVAMLSTQDYLLSLLIMQGVSLSLGIILLAAGESARLGSPKQLMQWKGESLLQQSIRKLQSLHSPFVRKKRIVVVLGAHADSITPTLDSKSLLLVHNTEWQSGMASSLRCGMKALTHSSEFDAVLLWVCDQPLIDADFLEKLVATFATSATGIAASRYHGILGVPAIFSKEYCKVLASLQGDRGARSLLQEKAQSIAFIECPEAAFDIDTPEDYTTALQQGL